MEHVKVAMVNAIRVSDIILGERIGCEAKPRRLRQENRSSGLRPGEDLGTRGGISRA